MIEVVISILLCSLPTVFLMFLVFRLVQSNLIIKIGLLILVSTPGVGMGVHFSGMALDNMVLLLLSFLIPWLFLLAGASLIGIGALFYNQKIK